jgi:tetratricopeptide (TPR) repeat protein
MPSLTDVLSVLMIPSASDAQSASFWLGKGNELCNSGQMDEAVKAYKHALSIDKELVDAWNNQGLALASMDQYEKALHCFDEVPKLSPQHKHALSNKPTFRTNGITFNHDH